MSTKRPPKRHARRIPKNEWLAVVASLDELLARQAPQDSRKARTPSIDKNALAAVNTAYAATLRYYTALLEGGEHDPRTQREISRLWQKAGTKIRHNDPVLANRLKASNRFWTEDVTWTKETIQQAWARLNSIRASANTLNPDIGTVQRWSTFSSS